MMKAAELRELSGGDLETRLDETKEEYFNLRFQQVSGQLEDFNQIKTVKRNIARILTIMRERELEAEEDAE